MNISPEGFAFRLRKDDMLRESIHKYAVDHKLTAGSIVSGVGCLQNCNIRLADESKQLNLVGPLEILTLAGTVSQARAHLHISVADKDGKVYGGHLMEGSKVLYTVETCGYAYKNMNFSLEFDQTTGFNEFKPEYIN